MKKQMREHVFLVLSLINLAVGCSFGRLIIHQYTVFTVINTYIFISCLLSFTKSNNVNVHKCFNFINFIAKLAILLGFFILWCNVFVLDDGVRSCESCSIANVGIIIAGSIYALFYLCFLCFYVGSFILNSNIVKLNA